MNRLVYTVEETAELLGLSRSSTYEAVRLGDIPSLRIGRRYLIPKQSVENLLNVSGKIHNIREQ